MRKVFIVFAVSAASSLASASEFSMPSGNQAFGATSGMSAPNFQADNAGDNTVSVTAIPAPGTAVMAIAGLVALGRRRRDK